MIKIDVRGKNCPIPVIEAKKALKNIEEDGTVLVKVDNEIAKENLEKMSKVMGYEYESKMFDEDYYEVKIIKGLGSDTVTENEDRHGNKNTLVVISSDKMGSGNNELGEVLMKGFIYALTEMESLPRTIIFYNGGVKFTVKDSPVLKDLKSLENEGVEIVSCGTCLDYYKLMDKFEVGSVTNMYNIVELMDGAEKIIKP